MKSVIWMNTRRRLLWNSGTSLLIEHNLRLLFRLSDGEELDVASLLKRLLIYLLIVNSVVFYAVLSFTASEWRPSLGLSLAAAPIVSFVDSVKLEC